MPFHSLLLPLACFHSRSVVLRGWKRQGAAGGVSCDLSPSLTTSYKWLLYLWNRWIRAVFGLVFFLGGGGDVYYCCVIEGAGHLQGIHRGRGGRSRSGSTAGQRSSGGSRDPGCCRGRASWRACGQRFRKARPIIDCRRGTATRARAACRRCRRAATIAHC